MHKRFLADTPESFIIKIWGQKSEKYFYKYIRVFLEKAAYKIKDIWKEGGRCENKLTIFIKGNHCSGYIIIRFEIIGEGNGFL